MRATDGSFLDLMRRYLRPWQVEQEPEELSEFYSADLGVRKVLAGGRSTRPTKRLYAGSGVQIYQGRVDDEVAGRIIGSMRDMVTAHAHEFVRIRAGAVTIDGAALVMPTAPEPHMPALVGSLVRAGARYLGDEMVYLDPVLRRLHGSSLPLLVDTEDMVHFPELGREPGRRPRQRRPTPIEGRTPRRPVPLADLGGTTADPSLPRWIVFPTFEPGAETKLEPLGGSSALFRFIQSGLNLHIWKERAFTLMQELMEAMPVSQLTIGSIEGATDLLLQAMPRMADTAG